MKVQSRRGWLYLSFREKAYLWHLALGRLDISWVKRGEKW